MDSKELEKRIKEANDEFLKDEPVKEETREVELSSPVDLYKKRADEQREASKRPRLNGSTQKLLVDICAVTENLTPKFNKARDDSERLMRLGDKQGARISREQYMQDFFLPAVQSLVMTNSPEELMNSTKVLSELDKMALTDGGRADGYTYAFVSQLYKDGMGGVVPTSDAMVEDAVRKIVRLVQTDQIRTAVGMAQRIKESIDSGENTASSEDYELIQNVALRGK